MQLRNRNLQIISYNKTKKITGRSLNLILTRLLTQAKYIPLKFVADMFTKSCLLITIIYSLSFSYVSRDSSPYLSLSFSLSLSLSLCLSLSLSLSLCLSISLSLSLSLFEDATEIIYASNAT